MKEKNKKDNQKDHNLTDTRIYLTDKGMNVKDRKN